MTEVVYNACYGGFGLSNEAILLYVKLMKEKNGIDCEVNKYDYGEKEMLYLDTEPSRHDPILVEVVKNLGDEANGFCANLKISTISGSLYRIGEYDGLETVETPSGVNWINALE